MNFNIAKEEVQKPRKQIIHFPSFGTIEICESLKLEEINKPEWRSLRKICEVTANGL